MESERHLSDSTSFPASIQPRPRWSSKPDQTWGLLATSLESILGGRSCVQPMDEQLGGKTRAQLEKSCETTMTHFSRHASMLNCFQGGTTWRFGLRGASALESQSACSKHLSADYFLENDALIGKSFVPPRFEASLTPSKLAELIRATLDFHHNQAGW